MGSNPASPTIKWPPSCDGGHFPLGPAIAVPRGRPCPQRDGRDSRLRRTTNEDDLIGVTEAAGALGVTPRAVGERLAAGTLPGRKIGRNWVLPASAPHR